MSTHASHINRGPAVCQRKHKGALYTAYEWNSERQQYPCPHCAFRPNCKDKPDSFPGCPAPTNSFGKNIYWIKAADNADKKKE